MIWLVIMITLLVILLIVVGYIFFLSRSKWFVEVRELCGGKKDMKGRRIVHLHKAIEVKQEGIPYLKIPRTGELIPLPPSECVDITAKGKKWVVVYKHNTGDYTFCYDSGNDNECFQPFTQTQRLVLIDQLKKAYARRRKSLMDLLVPIAGLSALTLIAICLMIFYGDMAKPLLEMGETQAGIQEDQRETVRMIQEIIQKKQMLDDNPAGENTIKPPDVGDEEDGT